MGKLSRAALELRKIIEEVVAENSRYEQQVSDHRSMAANIEMLIQRNNALIARLKRHAGTEEGKGEREGVTKDERDLLAGVEG